MEAKNLHQETTEAISLLKNMREEFEKKSSDFGKIEKMSVRFEELEEKNRKIFENAKLQEKRVEEYESRLKDFEKIINRMPITTQNPIISEERKQFKELLLTSKEEFFLKYNNSILKLKRMRMEAPTQNLEKNYMRTDVGPQGGFLVPTDYRAEISKELVEISPVRQLAQVITVDRKTQIPVRTNNAIAYWCGEGATIPDTQSYYGLKTLYLKEIAAATVVTWQMLASSIFDIEQQVKMDIAEAFKKEEGRAFVKGAGPLEPEGFMTSSLVPTINSGDAAAIQADNFYELLGALKSGYKPTFGFNRKTMATIFLLKNNNEYVFRYGNMAAAKPNTIIGIPYVILPDMDDVAPNAYPVVLADFKKGYYIGDQTEMMFIKNEQGMAMSGKVEYVFHSMLGGLVVQPEAFVKLKIAV